MSDNLDKAAAPDILSRMTSQTAARETTCFFTFGFYARREGPAG